MKFGVRTTEKETNSTRWAITENGNASHFSFLCQVIAFKMSSYRNTIILSIIISFVIYLCWVKRWPKRLVNRWFTAGFTRDSTPQPQKIQECFVWLVIFAAVIEVHQRAWQHILEVISFWAVLCIVLGCCTFLVEKDLLPSSGQFWLSGAVKAVELCWRLWLEMPQLKCQDPACLLVQRVRTWFEGCWDSGLSFTWGVPWSFQGAAGTRHTSIQSVWHDCFTWKGKNNS